MTPHLGVHDSCRNYDVVVKPVAYPGLTITFDIWRDFNFEMARALTQIEPGMTMGEAEDQVEDFTLYAELYDAVYDCRADLRFLQQAYLDPSCKLKVHKYTAQERQAKDDFIANAEEQQRA